jgi:hypothetical protein
MEDKELFTMLGKFTGEQKMPPVQDWRPDRVGEIDIHIDLQGRWFHEGGHFERQDLARMFASILRIENTEYYLVTPAEKLRIRVDDVPFVVVLMKCKSDDMTQRFSFMTSMGDEVTAGAQHEIEWRPLSHGGSAPYIEVRDGLWARINQNVYYELMNYVEEGPQGFFLRSSGVDFKVPE